MFVFTTRFRIYIPLSFSLKDKRQVVRSLKDKFRGAFKIPIVEVGEQDNKNTALLALTFVCEKQSYGDSLNQKMMGFIEDNCGEEIMGIEAFIEKY